MRALVTGGAGFIGSHLVDDLVADGREVRITVRPGSADAGPVHPAVEVVEADLRDPVGVRRAVQDCDHVYHLAARTSRRGGARIEYEAANVGGVEHVARAALEAGTARVVHCSTAGVHGFGVDGVVDETTGVRPNSTYRATKAEAEAVVRRLYQRDGLPVVTVRFTDVIGSRGLAWLGLFRAVATGSFRIIGSGGNRVPLTPVGDLVRGLRLCAETPDIEGQTLLLGGVDSITLGSFLHAIAEALGVSLRLRHAPAAPFRAYRALSDAVWRAAGVPLPRAHLYEFFLLDRHLNTSRARDRLGFVPEIPLRRSIRDTARWYRETGRL